MTAIRNLLLALVAVLGFAAMASSVAAQESGSTPTPAAAGSQAPEAASQAADAASQAPEAHAQEGRTMVLPNDAFFMQQFAHSVPHQIWPHHDPKAADGHVDYLAFYNVNLYQWVAIVLLLVLFLPVVGSFKQKQSSWVTRVLRGWCLWIRDEMVYPVMGKEEGRVWAPYFIFLFFFIAAMNCIGLVPSIPQWHFDTGTSTGTPYVTVPLAVVTLVLMLGMGIKNNGFVGFFKGLLPHGLPIALLPLMFVIELVSLVVKPFALTIRLFANMLAGHLVIASAIGLVFLFAKMMGGGPLSYVTAVPACGMAVFIFIIEAFVTLLQAYIFTLLSINFVYASMHQEH